MALSKEEACQVLKLPIDATKKKAIQHYKILAVKNFPDKYNRSSESLKVFENLTLAICTFLNQKPEGNLHIGEMLSLFQSLFFKNESVNSNEDDDGVSDSYTDDSEDDFFDMAAMDEYLGNRRSDESEEEVKPVETVQSKKKNAIENAKELIQEEERAKKKAERKKTQKKRRKERKKKEKEAEKGEQHEKKGTESEEEQKIEQHNATTSESEEEIDTSSAFVAVIAKKRNRATSMQAKKEKEKDQKSSTKSHMLTEEDATSLILRSRQLALRGNEMANSGHYTEAIQLFTEAIKLQPNDHRFYGNRSYCYDRLGRYDRALQDAERSISLVPDWPKGHFRKGRALVNLKKFEEAEACFQEVLKLDPDCDDAVKEQLNLRVNQIVNMGFSRIEAETALEEHGIVSLALESLLSKRSVLNKKNDTDIFFSDDDDGEISQYFKTIPRPPSQTLDIKMDPNNPEGHNSLWVGNVQPQVTESTLTSLFAKYGELLSIKLMPEKFCAFVNFKNPKSAGMAMRALQGVELFGVSMLIRFPNITPKASATATTSKSGPSMTVKMAKDKVVTPSDECYFWRTTGCIRGSACKYKHVEAHKGIDRHKVLYKS